MFKENLNKIKLSLFLFINRLKLKNKKPTIISNNCIAGIIYHDLKLKFLSPTINLYIPKEYFSKYVNNIETYSKCELIENTSNTEYTYPIGILKNNSLGDIPIHFMHYSSFAKAKKKWIDRTKRISFNNIYVIFEIGLFANNNLLTDFDNIKFNNKIALVPPNISHEKCQPISTCYDENWLPGRILKYNYKTGKRFLHEWDFVKFLNQK